MRQPIFGSGSAQVLGVAGALALAAMLAGVDWKIAVIAALGLSLSSTAIALATIDERNLKGTPTGTVSFAILLFQDIAAIPMIAVVPLLGVAAAGQAGGGWLQAAKVAGVIGALILSGRFLVRPALRAIAKSGLREIFTAFSLLLVIAIALLMQSVGLSMVCTPLLLIVHDKLIAPRYRVDNARKADPIDANDGHVIIAGFGRFGQIVGRLLTANKVPLTVLDHDPDQIDLVRKFGSTVFYGDATRIDLLHAAGAAHARALVVAIDDIDDSLRLVDAVREAFPELTIMARARNVTHTYDLMDRGVQIIERETFESALLLGRHVLQHLGFGAYQARQAACKFRQHNIQGLARVYPVYKDHEQYVSQVKQGRDELETMFSLDAEAVKAEHAGRWD